MWNIEFKGKLKGDIEQISSGAPLPEGSVMFKEPDSSDKAFAQGGLIALPLILIIIGLAVFRICTVYSKPDGLNFKTFALPFGISFALMLLSQYIHEYIHAFLMPRSIKKQIYVKKAKLVNLVV